MSLTRTRTSTNTLLPPRRLFRSLVPPPSTRSHPPCTFRRALYTEASRGRASRRGLRARARSAVRVLDSAQPRPFPSTARRPAQHAVQGHLDHAHGLRVRRRRVGCAGTTGLRPGVRLTARGKVQGASPPPLPAAAPSAPPLSQVPSRRASRSRTPCPVVAVSFFAYALRGSRSRSARCARVSWCLSLAVSSLRWQPRRAGHAVPALVLTLPASLPVRP